MHDRIIRLVLLTMLGLFACASFVSAVPGQQATPPAYEDRTHDDNFTFKSGKPYQVDPYTWVYTKEFAQKFRMPDKWIDANLKGAIAIAFRMSTIGNVTCGLGGREDSCWPPVQCQLDVYYDNNTSRFPWKREEIIRDFLLRGISSQEFLNDLHNSKGIQRYRSKDGKGVPKVLATEASLVVGQNKFGMAPVAYFDREYEQGVGLIGWMGVGVCPKTVGVGQIAFFDADTQEKINHMQIKPENAKPIHVIELPETFMRRANTVYERDNKPNASVSERLREEFLESQKPKSKP